MSAPTRFTAMDFLNAETLVNHLMQNLTIKFQIESDTYDHETMQRHLKERSALIITKELLLDEVERLIK